MLLSCFISSLDLDIRREVQALQPLTLAHATGLARLQEDKLAAQRRSPSHSPSHHLPPPPNPLPLPPPPNPNVFSSPSSSTPLLPTPPKPPPLPFRRLTPAELASRRERGLCFHCDEKFTRGHRCASRFFLLVADEDDPNAPAEPLIDNPNPNPDEQDPPQPDQPKAQISFYALSGHSAPKTLRLLGHLANRPVIILVDGGSTHNFMQARLVRHLDLTTQPTPPLRVHIGNGNLIESHQLCPFATLQIQGHTFTLDLHVLPICGADVVLGVHWLKSLGPILTDYSTLTMKFVHQGNIIELRGDATHDIEAISPTQLRRMVQTNAVNEFFHLRVCPSPPSSPTIPPFFQLSNILKILILIFHSSIIITV